MTTTIAQAPTPAACYMPKSVMGFRPGSTTPMGRRSESGRRPASSMLSSTLTVSTSSLASYDSSSFSPGLRSTPGTPNTKSRSQRSLAFDTSKNRSKSTDRPKGVLDIYGLPNGSGKDALDAMFAKMGLAHVDVKYRLKRHAITGERFARVAFDERSMILDVLLRRNALNSDPEYEKVCFKKPSLPGGVPPSGKNV